MPPSRTIHVPVPGVPTFRRSLLAPRRRLAVSRVRVFAALCLLRSLFTPWPPEFSILTPSAYDPHFSPFSSALLAGGLQLKWVYAGSVQAWSAIWKTPAWMRPQSCGRPGGHELHQGSSDVPVPSRLPRHQYRPSGTGADRVLTVHRNTLRVSAKTDCAITGCGLHGAVRRAGCSARRLCLGCVSGVACPPWGPCRCAASWARAAAHMGNAVHLGDEVSASFGAHATSRGGCVETVGRCEFRSVYG
jgi:hypothetical protein